MNALALISVLLIGCMLGAGLMAIHQEARAIGASGAKAVASELRPACDCEDAP
jgi:hypothetical protein